MTKWVYGFGGGTADGRADMKNLLGDKGPNLAEMSSIGVPVPAGFTATSEVCIEFGDAGSPLLVSVHFGMRASMPTVMDTVFGRDLNDTTVVWLVNRSGDRRFAYDSCRRFIQMYSDVALRWIQVICGGVRR